jgi:hypothetical protein
MGEIGFRYSSRKAEKRVAMRSDVSKLRRGTIRFYPSFSEADDVRVMRVDDVRNEKIVISV